MTETEAGHVPAPTSSDQNGTAAVANLRFQDRKRELRNLVMAGGAAFGRSVEDYGEAVAKAFADINEFVGDEHYAELAKG